MSEDDDYNFYAPGDYPSWYLPDRERHFLDAIKTKNEDFFKQTLGIYGFGTGSFIEGLNLLQLAAKHDFMRGVEILCERGFPPSAKGYDDYKSALDYAVLNNNYEMCQTLLSRGADANSVFKYYKDSRFPEVEKCTLGFALEMDAPHFVQLLLNHGANPNAYHEGEPLITFAAKHSHPSTVDLLAIYRANVNVQDCDGNTALHIAALRGQEHLVKRLVEKHYANPCIKNNNQDMPMHLAVHGRNQNILKTLQQHGTPIFELNCGGKSVVSLVVEQNDNDTLSCVFDHWLREFSFMDRKEWRLNRYLADAARNQNVVSMDYLVRHVSDFNEVDHEGKTTLHHVCKNGSEEQFNILLPYLDEVDLNKPDCEGNTAIIYAAGCENPILFLTLLERGANPDVVNGWGAGVLDKARQRGEQHFHYIKDALTRHKERMALTPALVAKHQSTPKPFDRTNDYQNMG